MFTTIKTTLTHENIVPLLNDKKLFIEKTLLGNDKPVGDAADSVLSFAPSYSSRRATIEDLPLLMRFIGFSVYITPVSTPESIFSEGITA